MLWTKELNYYFKKLVRRYAPLFAFGLISCGLAYLFTNYYISHDGQKREIQLLQYFYSNRESREPPPNVVIAAIDDITYQDLEKEVSVRDKFPRIKTAQALEKISAAKPKVMILDAKFPKEIDDPVADDLVEKVLKNCPCTLASGELPYYNANLSETEKFQTLILPSDEKFAKAAKMNLNMWVKSSYGVRHTISLFSDPKMSVYDKFILLRPLHELTDLKTHQPSDFDFINFYGSSGTIKRVSLSKIYNMNQQELEANFKDKVVLFGYQSISRGAGTIDKEEFIVSASYVPMFGVEIHANIVGNYLDGSFIKRMPPDSEYLTIFWIVLFLTGIGILIKPEKTIPLLVLFTAAYSLLAYRLFAYHFFWLPGVVTIFLASLIVCIATSFWHYKYIKKISKVWEKTFNFDLEEDEK